MSPHRHTGRCLGSPRNPPDGPASRPPATPRPGAEHPRIRRPRALTTPVSCQPNAARPPRSTSSSRRHDLSHRSDGRAARVWSKGGRRAAVTGAGRRLAVLLHPRHDHLVCEGERPVKRGNRASRRRSVSLLEQSLSSRALIGHAVVASTAAGRGPLLLALCGGPAKDQPVPTVVRCRKRQQNVAPG